MHVIDPIQPICGIEYVREIREKHSQARERFTAMDLDTKTRVMSQDRVQKQRKREWNQFQPFWNGDH